MKKETIQILIGVGVVSLIGVGAVLLISHKNKEVPTSLLDKLSDAQKKMVLATHPNARKKFAEFIVKVEKAGYKVLMQSGYRDFHKQARLHAEDSRNARAGYSNHNYGYALDINIIDPKTGDIILRKSSSKQKWIDSGIVKIAKDLGLDWGGDFKSYHDPIHFFVPRDKTTSQMKKLVEEGKVDKEGYVLAFSGRNRLAS